MKWLLSIIITLCLLALAGCAQTTPTVETSASPITTETPPGTAITDEPSATKTESPSPSSAAPRAKDYEVELVAKTLRGECYDDQPDDKREVAKVICNRVSVGGFGDSIEAAVTAPHQFVGYRPGNEPTANDYEIAREVLTAWCNGGCVPLGEYLYFSSGEGHKNVFRKEWKGAS
jgi:hypothetical protein